MGLEPYGGQTATSRSRLPDEADRLISLKEAAGSSRFWLFGTALFFHMLCIQTVTVHIVPSATDIGISATVAATILSVFAGVSLFGQLATGHIADSLGNRKMLVFNLGLAMLALIQLPLAKSAWALYLTISLLGLTGGMVPLQPLLTAEFFGLKSVGAILAGIMFFGTVGGAVGPALAGYITDATGSYTLAYSICAACGVLAFILSLFMLRPDKTITAVTNNGGAVLSCPFFIARGRQAVPVARISSTAPSAITLPYLLWTTRLHISRTISSHG
jgi:MFS family permease